MPLEATMICLDNSDWMRNGDYAPSRLEAQHDAASMICNDRTGSNPENTVGILTMAGQGVDLLVSPTEESGKILAAFAGIPIGGKSNLTTAVQIAQLALKHRKNKNGGQRIIAFVGGPIAETVEKLQKIGKQLKKNNVAIDLISIGETEENSEKLLEFVNAANSNDNSHLITVPVGVSPGNALMSSPLMHAAGMAMGADAAAGGAGGGGGGNFDMYGGIDPELDPELAMAIRISAEEARAHEEAGAKAAQEQDATGDAAAAPGATTSGAASSSSSSSGSGVAAAGAGGGFVGGEDQDEEALMQQALAMSMQEMMSSAQPTTAGAGGVPQPSDESSTDVAATGVAAMEINSTIAEEDEDEDLRRAMELSIAQAAGADSTAAAGASAAEFSDPDFVNQLLGTSDQSDPLIQAALQQLQQQQSSSDQQGNGGTDGSSGQTGGKKRKNGDGDGADK